MENTQTPLRTVAEIPWPSGEPGSPELPHVATLKGLAEEAEATLKAQHITIERVEVVHKPDSGDFGGNPSTESIGFKIYGGGGLYGTALYTDPRYQEMLDRAQEQQIAEDYPDGELLSRPCAHGIPE